MQRALFIPICYLAAKVQGQVASEECLGGLLEATLAKCIGEYVVGFQHCCVLGSRSDVSNLMRNTLQTCTGLICVQLVRARARALLAIISERV